MVGSFPGEFGVSGAGGNIRKYRLLLETFLRNWWQMASFTLPPVQSNYLILETVRKQALRPTEFAPTSDPRKLALSYTIGAFYNFYQS